jgi:hypothetical protein
MSEKWKKRVIAGAYALAMAAMAASLSFTELRPTATASTCPNEGTPCNLVNGGGYGCTGGINGGEPIAGCGCDIGNFCIGQ